MGFAQSFLILGRADPSPSQRNKPSLLGSSGRCEQNQEHAGEKGDNGARHNPSHPLEASPPDNALGHLFLSTGRSNSKRISNPLPIARSISCSVK